MGATEVKAIENGDSYSVLIGEKVACSMSSGGVHRFRTQTQAEVFGGQYLRGYTGGTFLSGDVDNYVTNL
jgi:hypothetical protein